MTLEQLVSRIEQLDSEDVLFVKKEWTPQSEAAVFRLTSEHRAPPEATAGGYDYFLEVPTAREVVEWFSSRPDATLEEKTQRLIHYAIYDA